MSVDVALTIEWFVPAAQYIGSVTDNTKGSYDKLIWEDEREKPSWTQIQYRGKILEVELYKQAIRLERNEKMLAALAILDRHRNQKEYDLPTTITDADALLWAVYLQELRDVLDTIENVEDPIDWPVDPTN